MRRPLAQPLFKPENRCMQHASTRRRQKVSTRYLFMELKQILHIPFGDAQLGSMLIVPPDWRSARRVSELRTEPLWGLSVIRSESQAALF